jgi:hypothetical protein
MRSVRLCLWVCLSAALPAIAFGQGRQANPPNSRNPADLARDAERLREVQRLYGQTLASTPAATDVLTGPVVTDAPFSADATTTVTQTLGDGTRIEQSTTAKFFRDRIGRVRREQAILGLGALNNGGNAQTITIDPDPGDGTAYTLDPMTRTARRVPRVAIVGNLFIARSSTGVVSLQQPGGVGLRTGGPGPAGNRPTEESLGTRQFESIKAIGRKTTTIIPTGQIGNDRPIEITDERWESPELRMLVYSRTSDPRTGVVEYRLTNINRAEPPADLFMIPSDYSVNEPATVPGARGRGAREGGPGTTR